MNRLTENFRVFILFITLIFLSKLVNGQNFYFDVSKQDKVHFESSKKHSDDLLLDVIEIDEVEEEVEIDGGGYFSIGYLSNWYHQILTHTSVCFVSKTQIGVFSFIKSATYRLYDLYCDWKLNLA